MTAGVAPGETGAAGVRIAVLIPYYQRTAGLLAAALNSVFSQSVLTQGGLLDVLVIDDHSPHDPREDLRELTTPPGVELRLLQTRANGGPGVARNHGLEAVRAETDFVAFLDSDEVWTEPHLENALFALSQAPADIYFANYSRGEWGRDKFSITGFGSGHPALSKGRGLYRFSGDPLAEVLIRATVRIQTCVVRWSELSAHRFHQGLAIGEDADYVARGVTELGSRLCYSIGVETIEERPGVNVSQNSGKDPAKECDIRLKMLRYQVYVLRRFGNCSGLQPGAREALNEARYNGFHALIAPGLGLRQRFGALTGFVFGDRGFLPWCLSHASRSLALRVAGR